MREGAATDGAFWPRASHTRVTAACAVWRAVETQLLHHDGEDWRGYTYAWRDDHSDADLVPPDGAEKVFKATDGFWPNTRVKEP